MRTEPARRVARLAAGLMAVAVAGGAAAQTCERPDQSHVVCRFVTSRPEPLRVHAKGWIQGAGRGGASGELALSVDGVPCESGRVRGRRLASVEIGCHGRNDLVRHVAVAELRDVRAGEPAGVLIALQDSERLADLPREAAELSGPPRPRRSWLRLRLPHLPVPLRAREGAHGVSHGKGEGS